MILITTAGKVGTQAALTLAGQGTPVRVLVRDRGRHSALADAGAELVVGDLGDPAAIASAVDDVACVILVSPAVPREELAVVDAARDADVAFVVKATSKASDDSPIARRRGQTEIERGLERSGIPHALLRSNAYMQNFLVLAPAIAATDSFASSVGDGRTGLVDARDVGDVAAAIAARPDDHRGATYRLTGPDLLTYADAAEVLSRVLGRSIAFAPRSQEADVAAMVAAGLPEAVAQQNGQAFALTAKGDAAWLSDDVPEILGRPARSFGDFVRDYAAAFTR